MTSSIAPLPNGEFIDRIRECILPNGMNVLVHPFEHAPRMSMYFFLPGGNLIDAVPGMSDLVDRLLMKETTNRTQEQLSLDIDALSLELDIDTRRDFSMIGATFLPEDLEASLEIIADIVYNATLASFEREKLVMAGEIQMELDSPQARASDQMIRTVFENSLYGVTNTVFLENIEKFTSVEQLKQHYHGVYRPERMIVSAAGQFEAIDLTALLLKYFPKKEEGKTLKVNDTTITSLKTITISNNTAITSAKEDSSQLNIYKAWIAPNLQHDDYYPLMVLNTLFGSGGLSSRLFLELRDKQGLAYSIRSSYEGYRYSGLFSIYMGTEPSNKEKCLAGFDKECQKLFNELVSDKELEETKRNILGRRTVFLETASQWASYVGSNTTMGRSFTDLKNFDEHIQGVTANDIQRVAKTYLDQPAIISMVGPSAVL
jgi:predicted Zn-dependent peptidase